MARGRLNRTGPLSATIQPEGGGKALPVSATDLLKLGHEPGGTPIVEYEQNRRGEVVSPRWVIDPDAPPPPQPVAVAAVQPTPAAIDRGAAPGEYRFRNPYTFIPTPPRAGRRGPLADSRGPDRGSLDAQGLSGHLRVRLTTSTPLLLPDAAEASADENGHHTFPVALDAEGNPLLRPTAIRGALRSAYEAITNSRFGVFTSRQRLGYRMGTHDATNLVPARIVADSGPAGYAVELLFGGITPAIGRNGELQTPPSPWNLAGPDPHNPGKKARRAYSAFVMAYPRNGDAPVADADDPNNHERLVEVDLRQATAGRNRLHVWRVETIRPAPSGATPTDPVAGANGTATAVGIQVVTGHTTDKKHYERVFIGRPVRVSLGPDEVRELRRNWDAVIANYRAEHLEPDGITLEDPSVGPGTEWSAHIRANNYPLQPGRACFARIAPGSGGARYVIEGLYPVQIGREVHDRSPYELLEGTDLAPATDRAALSPADRVFGWVNQEGPGAWRGGLRISGVRCTSPPTEAVVSFPEGQALPLAILSAPKPQDPLFYFASNQLGQPIDPTDRRGEAVAQITGLRGRKIYIHHRGLEGKDAHTSHWVHSRTAEKRVGQHYGEFVRPGAGEATAEKPRSTDDRGRVRDNQNRSITDWVAPGTTFEFDLRVSNLTPAEMGALLWLLRMPEDAHLRLGFGKPLGFGSVRAELLPEMSHLESGAERSERWRNRFAATDASHATDQIEDQIEENIAAFAEAVKETYGIELDQAPFVAAFLAASRGGASELPVHYPRARHSPGTGPVAPHPDGLAYEWFVANAARGAGGCALPAPTPELPGLPVWLERGREAGRNGPRQGGGNGQSRRAQGGPGGGRPQGGTGGTGGGRPKGGPGGGPGGRPGGASGGRPQGGPGGGRPKGGPGGGPGGRPGGTGGGRRPPASGR